MKLIAYDDIKNNEEIRVYIQKSDVVLGLMVLLITLFDGSFCTENVGCK